MEWQEIEIPYGDYREIDFVIKDEGGEPLNVYGKGIVFAVKASVADSDEDAVLIKEYPGSDDIVLVAPEQGWVKVIVHSEETKLDPKTYFLELKVVDGEKVFTVTQAKMKVVPVVWRSEP